MAAQLEQLGANGLEQGGDADSFVNPRANIRDTKFKGIKDWMGSDIPPNLGHGIPLAEGTYFLQGLLKGFELRP